MPHLKWLGSTVNARVGLQGAHPLESNHYRLTVNERKTLLRGTIFRSSYSSAIRNVEAACSSSIDGFGLGTSRSSQVEYSGSYDELCSINLLTTYIHRKDQA